MLIIFFLSRYLFWFPMLSSNLSSRSKNRNSWWRHWLCKAGDIGFDTQSYYWIYLYSFSATNSIPNKFQKPSLARWNLDVRISLAGSLTKAYNLDRPALGLWREERVIRYCDSPCICHPQVGSNFVDAWKINISKNGIGDIDKHVNLCINWFITCP